MGFGNGWLLRVAEDIGCETYGVDFSIAGIKIAKARLKKAELVVSDVHHLPCARISIFLLCRTFKNLQLRTGLFRLMFALS